MGKSRYRVWIFTGYICKCMYLVSYKSMTVLSNKKRNKKCKVCSAEFNTFNTVQKYCSLECSKKARHTQTVKKTYMAQKRNVQKFNKSNGKKHGLDTLKCKTCKNTYNRYASQIKFRGSTYCSMECKKQGQIKSKTKGKLVKELDAAYSIYIRNKYAVNGIVECVTCGKKDEIRNMQNGHYVSRMFHSTRWLDKNCHPQCYRCNVALKGNYVNYTLFMIKTYGYEVIEELSIKSKEIADFSKEYISEQIALYKTL